MAGINMIQQRMQNSYCDFELYESIFSCEFLLSNCLLTSKLNKSILTVSMILTKDNIFNWMSLLHIFLSVSPSTNIFGFFDKNNYEGNNGYIAPSYDEESSSSGNKIKMKLKELHKRYYLHKYGYMYVCIICAFLMMLWLFAFQLQCCIFYCIR